VLPRLDAPWPLGDVRSFDAAAALEQLPQVNGLQVHHWSTLHQALEVEATDVVSAYVLALLPTPLRNVDRYGRPLDRYGVEVEPLLGALLGGHLPPIGDYASLVEAIAMIDIAIDMTTLALLPLRRDLDPICGGRLNEGVGTIGEQVRNLAAPVSPRRTGDQRLAAVRLLSRLGRLHQAEALSGLGSSHVDPACAMTVAAAWRYLHGFDRALGITEMLIRHAPHHTAARNTHAAVLCDVGRYHEAHVTAQGAWRAAKSRFTARTLLRTAKAVDDQLAFSEAQHYLQIDEGEFL